jgi:hypothetical protein
MTFVIEQWIGLANWLSESPSGVNDMERHFAMPL